MSSNSRRVRSTDWPAAKAWNWSARISISPTATGAATVARLGALAAPHDGLHAGDQLLRVTRLGDPVVGAHPQPAHALGHARLAGADDHAELRQPRAELLQVVPGLRPEHREVDHDGVEAHGDQRVERNGRGQHAVLPAGGAEALGEDLEEPAVGIQDREADRGLRRGRHRATSIGATHDAGPHTGSPGNRLVTSTSPRKGRSRIFRETGLTRVKRRRTRGRGP